MLQSAQRKLIGTAIRKKRTSSYRAVSVVSASGRGDEEQTERSKSAPPTFTSGSQTGRYASNDHMYAIKEHVQGRVWL